MRRIGEWLKRLMLGNRKESWIAGQIREMAKLGGKLVL
jgi:hypothetical protein